VALRGRGFVSVGAVVVCCALAAACSPDQSPASTPSPTPVTTAPAESQVERQMRLDYEAAEEAYRANMAELDRLYKAGGAVEATPLLDATATGSYLRISLKSLQDVREAGWRATAGTNIVGVVRDGGWKSGQVGLTSCEDNEIVRFVNKSGKDVTPDGLARYVQALTVVRESGRWKVSAASTTKVKTFKGQPCAA
jgi:hypothetical protein